MRAVRHSGTSTGVDVTLLVAYWRKVLNHYELVYSSTSR
jgi:hypothetical protein